MEAEAAAGSAIAQAATEMVSSNIHALRYGDLQAPRATHKIVFSYADSDDEEGTAAVVPAPSHDLTLDPEDLDEAGSVESLVFEEDARPALVEDEAQVYAASGIVTTRIEIQYDLPVPRAPDAAVTFYRNRALASRQATATVPVALEACPPADVGDAVAEPRPLVKREHNVKVTADGYHLTLDERDLVIDFETGFTRAPFARRPPRAEGEDAADNEAASTTVALEGAAAAAVPSDVNDEADDGDEEEDEEEDEEDLMMDDLLLVAAAEQLIKSCEEELATCPPTEPRDVDVFRTFVDTAKAAHERLCAGEMQPMEFGLAIKPLVGRVYGVLKRASRPPKPAPIVINGVVMDM